MCLCDELIEQLNSAQADGRYEAAANAAEALGESGCLGAVESLIEALGAQDYEGRQAEGRAILLRGPGVARVQFRESVATALGLLKDNRAIRPLINALHDDPSVSTRAIEALSNFSFDEVEQPINLALTNGNRYIQENAIRTLAKLGDRRATGPIVELLQGDNFSIRRAAIEALGQLSDTQAVGPLIEILEDEDWITKGRVAEALGQIGDPAATIPLIRLLQDHHFTSLGKVEEALGKLGDRQAVMPLIQSLERPSLGAKEAIAALAKLGDNRAIGPLVQRARNGSVAAAKALRTFRFEDGGKTLIEVLNDADAKIRANAAKALGIIGNHEATAPLVQALDDRRLQVREQVVYALGKLGSACAVERLHNVAANDGSEVVRRAARHVLEGL